MDKSVKLKISGVAKESVVDGPGLRLVVFAQGCNRACPGCHNPASWDPNGGVEVTAADLLAQISGAKLLKGVTFSGGEPFLQAWPLALLGEEIKKTGLDLITYTGYTWEELWVKAEGDPGVRGLLAVTDYLVDGAFLKEERSWVLPFRGSANQRFIDVAASLATGGLVLCFEEGAETNSA